MQDNVEDAEADPSRTSQLQVIVGALLYIATVYCHPDIIFEAHCLQHIYAHAAPSTVIDAAKGVLLLLYLICAQDEYI